MKKIITAVSLAALMGAASVAFAQDKGVGVGVDAGAGVSVETPVVDANAGVGANADANANASGASDNTYGSVMSAISGSASADLSAVTEDSQITIVLLSSLEGNAADEASALDAALTADAEGQTTLHSNIDGNAAIKAKLEAEGYASSDVVAVKSNADGSIIVYVDDRA